MKTSLMVLFIKKYIYTVLVRIRMFIGCAIGVPLGVQPTLMY